MRVILLLSIDAGMVRRRCSRCKRAIDGAVMVLDAAKGIEEALSRKLGRERVAALSRQL